MVSCKELFESWFARVWNRSFLLFVSNMVCSGKRTKEALEKNVRTIPLVSRQKHGWSRNAPINRPTQAP